MINMLPSFEFRRPVIFKAFERVILALSLSLFYDQLLMADSFPGDLLKQSVDNHIVKYD